MAGLPAADAAERGCGVPTVQLEEPDHSSSNWYFAREEIEKRSPSRMDGIDLKKETYFRKSYCTFLQDLGMCLKVPQVTIATAIVFCHRFFLRQSHLRNDRFMIATICMFLAGKVEETPRPLRDVILMSYEIRHKKDPTAVAKIKQKDVYEGQKELVLVGERLVLITLGFDLNIHHPYKPLVAAIKKFKVAQNALAQVAWNFVNDGLRTSLCLQFKPHHIASGAIFLAAKFLKVKLPSDGEKIWWQEFEVTPRQLEEVSNQMLELYEQNKSVGLNASRSSDAGVSFGSKIKLEDEDEEPKKSCVTSVEDVTTDSVKVLSQTQRTPRGEGDSRSAQPAFSDEEVVEKSSSTFLNIEGSSQVLELDLQSESGQSKLGGVCVPTSSGSEKSTGMKSNAEIKSIQDSKKPYYASMGDANIDKLDNTVWSIKGADIDNLENVAQSFEDSNIIKLENAVQERCRPSAEDISQPTSVGLLVKSSDAFSDGQVSNEVLNPHGQNDSVGDDCSRISDPAESTLEMRPDDEDEESEKSMAMDTEDASIERRFAQQNDRLRGVCDSKLPHDPFHVGQEVVRKNTVVFPNPKLIIEVLGFQESKSPGSANVSPSIGEDIEPEIQGREPKIRLTTSEDVNTERVKELPQRRRRLREEDDSRTNSVKGELNDEEFLERELERGVEPPPEADRVKHGRGMIPIALHKEEKETRETKKLRTKNGETSPSWMAKEDGVDETKRINLTHNGDQTAYGDADLERSRVPDCTEDGELLSSSNQDSERRPALLSGPHEKNDSQYFSKRHHDSHLRRDGHRDGRIAHVSRDKDHHQRDHYFYQRRTGGDRDRCRHMAVSLANSEHGRYAEISNKRKIEL